MDFECYDNMTVDELMVERDELYKDLDYEHSMALIRCRTSEGMGKQIEIVADLTERIDYVSTLIKERLVGINEIVG